MDYSDQIDLLKESMTSYRTRHRDGALWQQFSTAQQEQFLFAAWTDTAALLGCEPDLTRWQAVSAILEQALWLARAERLPERPRIVSETVEGLGSRRYSETAAGKTPNGAISPRTAALCQQLIRERDITLTRG